MIVIVVQAHAPLTEQRESALRFEEGQQVGVELILVCGGETMGSTWIDLELSILDDL